MKRLLSAFYLLVLTFGTAHAETIYVADDQTRILFDRAEAAGRVSCPRPRAAGFGKPRRTRAVARRGNPRHQDGGLFVSHRHRPGRRAEGDAVSGRLAGLFQLQGHRRAHARPASQT